MTHLGRHARPFRETADDQVPFPELNPWLQRWVEFGRPAVRSQEAMQLKGRWREAFERPAPLHLEIGSGNGFFLSEFARRHPELNLLGVEIRYKRLVTAALKVRKLGLGNALLTRYDAWWLDDLFEPGELAGLYLNHPDPWPKDRHVEKRLLGPWFTEWAAGALVEGAPLWLKTDALSNVDGLLEAIEGQPFELLARVEDIGANGCPWPVEDEIQTNFQAKFERKGLPVHGVVLRRSGA
jgi:tRNA (guanine-N7-)-methyltransferase